MRLNPSGQTQTKLPITSEHWADWSQLSDRVAHSSIFEQASFDPVHPFSQIQVKLPALFTQVVCGNGDRFVPQLCVLPVHSSVSEHVNPSPTYPELQEQLKDPWLLLHPAFTLQLCDSMMHSSTSEHVAPSPEYPELHTHAKLGCVLLQAAFP